MPLCPLCKNVVLSRDLRPVGDTIACPGCRRPKNVEEKMAERKKIGSLDIYEIPTKDGATDYQVEAEACYGGLSLKFETTFDRVRKFFTELREKGKEATLKSVP